MGYGVGNGFVHIQKRAVELQGLKQQAVQQRAIRLAGNTLGNHTGQDVVGVAVVPVCARGKQRRAGPGHQFGRGVQAVGIG